MAVDIYEECSAESGRATGNPALPLPVLLFDWTNFGALSRPDLVSNVLPPSSCVGMRNLKRIFSNLSPAALRDQLYILGPCQLCGYGANFKMALELGLLFMLH